MENIHNWKGNNKKVNISNQFCLGSISNKFDYIEAEGKSLKGNVYHISVDYHSWHKKHLQGLKVKNNIK